MPVVQNTATDPGGNPQAEINVRITLITGNPNTPGYTGSGDILGTLSIPTDANGRWSATLTGNAAITPENTYYQVVEGQAVSNIVVPASGGPYPLPSILVSPPPTGVPLGITGVQVAADGAVAGVRPEINLIAGSGMTVTAADNPTAGSVDVTLASSGGGGGTPSSTVDAGTSFGIASDAGTATAYSRGDHQHGTPAAPTPGSIGALAVADNLSDVANATAARGNLAAAKSGANSDITSLTGLTTPLPVAEGGTGAATLTGLAKGSGTGAFTAAVAGTDYTSPAQAATTVQAGTAYGTGSAVGTDTSFAREDHQHGTVALTSSAPAATEGIGQAGAAGTATTPARADHVHPLAAAGTPGASAVGDTAMAGSATTFAASDHKHGREAFGAVTAQTGYGAASGTGAAATVAHSDHVHGTPALTTTAPAATLGIGQAAALGSATLPALADHVHPVAGSGAPTTSAVGDTASAGAATTFAPSNHVHGRESFGSAPATTLGVGTGAAAGTATTPARSDHVHPTAAAAAPGASAVGDTTSTGVSTSPAAADHRHAREAFGAVAALSAFNTASANGAAASVSHSDHVHGAPALPAAAVSVPGLVTPPGGTAAFLRADATWAAPPGGASTAYSRQIVIAADGAPSTVTPPVGTWTPTYLMVSDTGGVWSGWLNESDGTQNDSISFDSACGAGTYTAELQHLAYANRGVYTLQIDGVSVGDIDGYAASLTAARSILAGISITAGAHVITLLMATQNASATGYYGLVQRIVLTRTA